MNLKDLVPEERMKIAALLAEKKGVNENAWMYEKSKEDPEAFLLGKQVQSLSQIQEICKESEESPAQRLARFDMEAKFREDPLTIMKQREAERRMELLKNTATVKKTPETFNRTEIT
uniref:SJCHGC01904 protein n=1 Tax=Schistosoma japonicum TaxID=6182 RepID=Q5DGR7_SCHJA|nr:SJCHGC01904 protein [Schistosoma japonicum]